MATAPSPNDLTRQQLDELDALLQRMLNLPLTAVDPPPPAPAGGSARQLAAVGGPAAPAPAPAPHLAAVELPRPPARAPRVTVTALPEAVPTAVVVARAEAPPEPAVPVLAAPPAAELAPPPAPEPMALEADDDGPIITPAALPGRAAGRSRSPARVADAPRPPAPPLPAAPEPASSAPRTPHSNPLLWPLVAVDRVADVVLGLMGPPGWLLRTGFGKNLLGLAGIGLLLYTGAHLAAGRGLLTLPFPLPWPG